MSDVLTQVTGLAETIFKAIPWPQQSTIEVEKIVIREVQDMAGAGRHGMLFIRLAGLSGAVAVAMGAYGAHVFRPSEADPALKLIFDTGNKYHFLHTLALLAVPLTNRPNLVGSLLTTGMLLFSGSCYYHALTGSTSIRRVTPYGGMLLIAGWVAMVL